ncbi:uncharacterized protein ACIB01_006664 isoform 3-T3 [Guaruba guarouba]
MILMTSNSAVSVIPECKAALFKHWWGTLNSCWFKQWHNLQLLLVWSLCLTSPQAQSCRTRKELQKQKASTGILKQGKEKLDSQW